MEQLMTSDEHWQHNWWTLMTTDDTIDEQWWQLMTIYVGASPRRICLTRKTWAQHLNVCVRQWHWLNWWQLMNTDGAIDDNWLPLIVQLMTTNEHLWRNWWQVMNTDSTTDENWWHNWWTMMTTDDNLRGRIASTHLPDKKDMGATPQCLC